MNVPNTEQQAAIEQFKAKYGPAWKDKLSQAWMAGWEHLEPNGHLLRQVRNNCGPSWLRKQK